MIAAFFHIAGADTVFLLRERVPALFFKTLVVAKHVPVDQLAQLVADSGTATPACQSTEDCVGDAANCRSNCDTNWTASDTNHCTNASTAASPRRCANIASVPPATAPTDVPVAAP